MNRPHGVSLEARSIWVRLGSQDILKGVSLSIEQGKVLAILGPSGSGKSTFLRAVAGLVHPSQGDIFLGGKSLNGVPSHKRGMGMVFQQYSLWPHLTVSQNIALPLKEQGIKGDDLKTKINEALNWVGLSDQAAKSPGTLSGGQKQRVAIARALALNPGLLLMDEPLSNLDRVLRESLLEEIRGLQKSRNQTTLFVTHDVQEAFTLGDRVAILKDGLVHVQGSPEALFQNPPDLWTAQFLGPLNIIPLDTAELQDTQWNLLCQGGLQLSLPVNKQVGEVPKTPKILAFRPNWATWQEEESTGLTVTLNDSWWEGGAWQCQASLPGGAHLRFSSLDAPQSPQGSLLLNKFYLFEGGQGIENP